MLFNLFGKKEARVKFSDKTFITAAAKQNACLELAKKKPNVLFIAWFADTASLYKQLFEAEGLDDSRVTEARQLHASKIAGLTPVFLEHFPMYTKEQELVKNWGIGEIDLYNSLDEPLFAHLGGESLVALMKKMGMAEDEMIQHPLVSKSILNAQEKIASKITLELPASSQRGWIEKNLK